MKIGFSLAGPGTSIRLDGVQELDEPMDASIAQRILSTPQPPPPRDDSVNATSAKAEPPSQDDVDPIIGQSLKERGPKPYKPIRREADGSLPALLFRNPEHFKIEGTVIPRTALDFDGEHTPFSTVMLDRVLGQTTMRFVVITILALPQTESTFGIIMFGCLDNERPIPKSPKGLGCRKRTSFALCSLDGMGLTVINPAKYL
ncbi:hypothetical protein BLNAU_17357 [Blattamonas nauphoetae]|uniref:Uncharacterized protein n=1 Tax=Blattamonas nauphoetae TaxID=2049346 RepID=A0ABQ9X8X9_9EUKA|nr:hypothetical protein BLNAU_17357 [Blattamonas nauphoetae]